MRARTLLVIAPLLWMVSTAFTQLSGHPWTSNGPGLKRLGKWVERFYSAHSRNPENLSEVRNYAWAKGQRVDLYDNYGERLYYQSLNDESFLIKSFGRDREENTALRGHDESYSHKLSFPAPGLRHILPDESRLYFYPSNFLEGLQSPRGPLHASLHVDLRQESKRLLIQSAKNPQFFMSPFHDAVDEFIWLPDGYELIFTGQGSNRYEDGIFYWNLKTNQVKNILPKLKEKYFPDMTDETKMFLSLSHVSDKPNFVYLFAVIAEGGSLDPASFYRYQNFYALDPREGFSAERVSADKDFSIFDYPIDHRALSDLTFLDRATRSQTDWLRLGLKGNPQELLESWQAYCSLHSKSPNLPYALWWLAALYNDTYRELLTEQTDKAYTVRNFGLEIAEALSQMTNAPLYLRAFGEDLKKNLLLSKPAAYNVASMNEKPEETAKDQPDP